MYLRTANHRIPLLWPGTSSHIVSSDQTLALLPQSKKPQRTGGKVFTGFKKVTAESNVLTITVQLTFTAPCALLKLWILESGGKPDTKIEYEDSKPNKLRKLHSGLVFFEIALIIII